MHPSKVVQVADEVFRTHLRPEILVGDMQLFKQFLEKYTGPIVKETSPYLFSGTNLCGVPVKINTAVPADIAVIVADGFNVLAIIKLEEESNEHTTDTART